MKMLCLGCVSSAVLCLFSALVPDAARAEWKGSISGDATIETFYWSSGPLGHDSRLFRPVGTLKVPTTLKNGRTVRFRLLPLVQSDSQSPTPKERFYWDPQEAYLQLQFLPWTMQLGYNVQTWGDTDVFNPLDVVNARRYYDPFRSEKRGAPTLLLKHEWDWLFLEALWIPWQAKTLIPGEESRWLPRDIYRSRKFEGLVVPGIGTLSGTINLPRDLRYHYLDEYELDNSLHHNFGARAKFRLPGFDWTLAAFQGAATAPSVNIERLTLSSFLTSRATTADVTVQPDVYLRALYYKSRMLGTSFVWVLGDFLVKGASAHTKVLSTYTADLLPKDTWENALGFERTFSVGKGSITALAQGTYVSRTEKLDTNSVSISRMFDRAAMAGLRWAPNERLTALASILHDIHFGGDLVHSDVSYKLADGVLAKLAGDILTGKTETPIGTYRQNDRVTVSLNVTK